MTAIGLVVGIGAGIAQQAGLVWLGLTAVVTGTSVAAGGITLRILLGLAWQSSVLRWVAWAAIVATVAQHSCLYAGYRHVWFDVRDREPALRLFRDESAPLGPWNYMRREATPQRLVVWGIDALMCLGSSLLLARLAIRPPEEAAT